PAGGPGAALPHAPPGCHPPTRLGRTPGASTLVFEHKFVSLSIRLLLRSNVSRGSDNEFSARRRAAAGEASGSRTLGGMATAAGLSDLGPREFLGEIDVLLGIYADAMDADAALLPGRRELMRRHAGYPEFKALQARSSNGGHDDGAVLGFSYGFHGAPGQWWYDAVSAALGRAIGSAATAGWLADCLEVAEVHVRKDQQRRGIGSRLLTALTAGRPEQTALLSTPDRESTARRPYRRVGFSDPLAGFRFSSGRPPLPVVGAVPPPRGPGRAARPARPAQPGGLLDLHGRSRPVQCVEVQSGNIPSEQPLAHPRRISDADRANHATIVCVLAQAGGRSSGNRAPDSSS